MNTFWWRRRRRWQCVYTNIISTTSVILNGRLTRRSDIRRLIVSSGQNQRLIMRRRKNGLSTCVEDQRFDGTGTNDREDRQGNRKISARRWTNCCLFSRWISLGEDQISNWNQQKQNTWINVPPSLVPISVNDDEHWWHPDCIVSISRIHARASLLCSALHSYWRIDQTQQEDHAVRCWLIPIGMSMCTSRNLALSMFDWEHLLPFSDYQRSEPVIWSAINATCLRHHLIFRDNDQRLHPRLPIFPWQPHVYVRFNWLINKSCSKRRKCLISSLPLSLSLLASRAHNFFFFSGRTAATCQMQ